MTQLPLEGFSLAKSQKGDRLHLVDALAETEVKEVSIDMGSLREEVTEVSAGNLASLTLTGKVQAGETLVDLAHKDRHGSLRRHMLRFRASRNLGG